MIAFFLQDISEELEIVDSRENDCHVQRRQMGLAFIPCDHRPSPWPLPPPLSSVTTARWEGLYAVSLYGKKDMCTLEGQS